MTGHDKLIADVIAAAEGEIVGRIRLQKMLYLLDQLGLEAEAAFHYHHYGPYSRVLDDALERAKAFYGVREELRSRSDGASYSVFHGPAAGSPTKLGKIDSGEVRRLISLMKQRTSTVLELAATIHWLISAEKVSNWRIELVRRKGIKTEGGRTEQALELLKQLRLCAA